MKSREGQIDLFNVEVFLKLTSGLRVLRQKKEMNLNSRRVVLSNYVNEDIRRRCLALGADRVFDKSSEIEELINYCDNAARH